jgi:hypothetical protein
MRALFIYLMETPFPATPNAMLAAHRYNRHPLHPPFLFSFGFSFRPIPRFRRWTLRFRHDRLGRLPDLDEIVLGRAADDPGHVAIPAELGDGRGVAGVHEGQLGRAVLGVLGRLLVADLAAVPQQDAAVLARAGEHVVVVRVPLDGLHAFEVAFEAGDVDFHVPHVPDADGFVGGAGGTEDLFLWMPGETVDVVAVSVCFTDGSVGVVGAGIDDFEGMIVRDAADPEGMARVVLDVVDGGRVDVVCLTRVDDFGF